MKTTRRHLPLFLTLIFLLTACQFEFQQSTPEPTSEPILPSPTLAVTAEPATAETEPTDVPATDIPAEDPAEPEEDETPSTQATDPIENPTFAEPLLPLISPISQPATAGMLQTAEALANNLPPARDDTALAKAYFGVDDTAIAASLPEPNIDYQIGDVVQFSVNNFNINTYATVNATLLGKSEYGYFWFDETVGNSQPDSTLVEQTGAEFDDIYLAVASFFGQENQPGIDGHSRVHVLNASPLTLCATSEGQTTVPPCGLLGYFSSQDALPKAVNANSNQKDMFVMNGSFFGGGTYLSTLAHEYRHMIEANYDANDIDWEVEGSAVLAEDLVIDSGDAGGRGNSFLLSPDQQLNRWSDGNTGPRYGQGYLLNRFIYDRIGTDLYREFAQSDLPGLAAATSIAESAGLPYTGTDIWLDWLIAPMVQDVDSVPARFTMPAGVFKPPFDTLGSGDVDDTTVNQFAADYYQLPLGQNLTIEFKGDSLVPLLDVQPTSGEFMWTARRNNYSMARLTRPVDLTGVSTATLEYDVYRDIELGYDFAYVIVSADGGTTWQSLVTDGMDGLAFVDDPGNAAFTERFYTGRGTGWMRESADLTPFAGQEILLRFEFVTDPILNFDGFAIDNLTIPEIGYVDDAEAGDDGWTAEGFVRATGYLPQTWHLMLVYPTADGVEVEMVSTDESGAATLELSAHSGRFEPFLVVAASAPVTLNPASYRIEVK